MFGEHLPHIGIQAVDLVAVEVLDLVASLHNRHYKIMKILKINNIRAEGII
tara:strand:+ start:249 stop:401 length:153 start_codon:yes stop_codon:yes gene_type:complete